MEHQTDVGGEGVVTATDEEAHDEEREPSAGGETVTAEAVEEHVGDEEDAVPESEGAVAAADMATTNGTAPSNGAEHVELYTDSDLEEFRRRWDTLLTGFVDDPRGSAEQADGLIEELVDRVSRRRQQLHDELGREDDRGETESMRQAIRRYRAIYRALVRQ
jgi:hypothetical protein